jgi:RHS repeat-associated protein
MSFLLRFAGMEYDAVTGQYYDRARSYSSVAGRFMGLDPSGFAAGPSNLYSDVGNGPTNTTDPNGEMQEPGSPVLPSPQSPPTGGQAILPVRGQPTAPPKTMPAQQAPTALDLINQEIAGSTNSAPEYTK